MRLAPAQRPYPSGAVLDFLYLDGVTDGLLAQKGEEP